MAKSELEKQMEALRTGTDTLDVGPSSKTEQEYRAQRGIPQKGESAPQAEPAATQPASHEVVHEAEVVSKNAPIPAPKTKPSGPTLEEVLHVATTMVIPAVKGIAAALKDNHAEKPLDKKKKEKKDETINVAAELPTVNDAPEKPAAAAKPAAEVKTEAAKAETVKAEAEPGKPAEKAAPSTAAARLNKRANKFFGTKEEDETPETDADPKKKKLIGGAGKKAINFLAGATAVGGIGAAVATLGVGGALSAAATVAWPVAAVAVGAAALVGTIALASHAVGVAADVGTSLAKGLNWIGKKATELTSIVASTVDFLSEKVGLKDDFPLRKGAQKVAEWSDKGSEGLDKLGKWIDKGHKGADALHKGGRYLNSAIGTAASAAGSALTFDAVGATEKLMNHGNKWDTQQKTREEAIAKAKEKPQTAAAKPETEKTAFTVKEEGKLSAEAEKRKVEDEPLAAKPKKEPVLTSALDTSDGVRVDDATGHATTVGKLTVDESALELHGKDDPAGGIPPAGERTVKGKHTARVLGVSPDVHESSRGYN